MRKRFLILFLLLMFILVSCKKEDDVFLYPAYTKNMDKFVWGFINEEGIFVIKPKYTSVENFNEGLSIVEKDGLFGLIDTEGNQVLEIKYQNISYLGSSYYLLNENSDLKIYSAYNKIISLDTKFSNILAYSNGYFTSLVKTEDGGVRFGYLDEKGREKIPFIYDKAFDFHLGRGIVRDGGKYKVIDRKNKTFKILNIDELRETSSPGIYIFKDKGYDSKYGLMDEEGKIILEALDFNLIDVKGNLILASKENLTDDKYGVLNLKGELVIDFKYGDVKILEDNYLAISDEIGKLGYPSYRIYRVDKGPINDELYYNIEENSKSIKLGYICVSDGLKTFFIDKNGEIENRLPVEDGFGIMDFDGEVVKSLIDGDLVYYRKNGDIIWEEDKGYKIDKSIEVVEKELRKSDNIKIKYPRFIGLDDELQSEINNSILDLFTKNRNDDINFKEYIDYKTFYNIYMKGDIISFEKNTNYLKKDSKVRVNEKVFYNINYKTGYFYSLKDLIDGEDQLDILNNLIFQSNELGSNYQRLKLEDGFLIRGDNIYFNVFYKDKDNNIKGYKQFSLALDKIKNIVKKGESYA